MIKRILYYMYIDWGWIKQRPHFLAEGLSLFYQVQVFCGKRFKKTLHLVRNCSQSNLQIKTTFRFPFIRWDFIYYANNYIMHNVIYKKRENVSDIIWFTHPSLYPKFRKNEKQIIVYDCMDDMLEFDSRENVNARIRKSENALCHEADILFCSSDYLKYKLIKRYALEREIYVVNNAIFLDERGVDVILPTEIQSFFVGDKKKIVYIGTIANWFDFDLIIQSLDVNTDIEYLMFGPVEVNVPIHERIHLCGSIEHKYVLATMSLADALIMPFQLTELIRSVNPVKAYEYIYSFKPVILPRYAETEKFGDFVSLYETNQEYIDIINMIVNGRYSFKESKENHQLFVKKNTWDYRLLQIKLILDSFS